jgi:hypothetical protein
MARSLKMSGKRLRERIRVRWLLPALLSCAAAVQAAEQTDYQFGGDIRTRGTFQSLPDDSVINSLVGSTALDSDSILRLKFAADRGSWDFKTDGQLIVSYGDSVEYTRELSNVAPEFEALFGRLINDDRRWWNLTKTIEDEGKLAVIGRLDRLSVSYTGKKTSLRFGRQALTWGNGLLYTPMDIVNPFDPTAVDTEYKTGDDMLYAQFLRDNGDDTQAAYVVRRDPLTGDIESDKATAAVKYHGFFGPGEIDLMLSQHYGEALFAIGGGMDVGGAVWRSDLVLSDTETEDVVAQFVINTSYSWVWGGKNVTGSAEYYFNGFGQSDSCYTQECLGENPELLERLARRQLFNLGRHYIGGNLLVEVTPLFTVTPNLFWNVEDPSALLQIVTQNNLGDNLLLLGALGIPIGASGTEYGGINSGVPGTYFSTDFSFFLQLNWYF